MSRLVVQGGGGFGREVLDVIAHRVGDDDWTPVVVDPYISQRDVAKLASLNVTYSATLHSTLDSDRYVVGVGSPDVRRRVTSAAESFGLKAVSLLDRRAQVAKLAKLSGEGVIVCAGAHISSWAVLDKHVHVNPRASVGPAARVGSYSSLNPASIVGAGAEIGSGVLVGARAVIGSGVRVGADCIVGAACIVIADVPPGVTVVGNPARYLRR